VWTTKWQPAQVVHQAVPYLLHAGEPEPSRSATNACLGFYCNADYSKPESRH
jgi:hypothetical protein